MESVKTMEMPKKSLYLPEMSEIVRVQQYTEKEKLFEIRLPGGRDLGHKPGQFVEVSIFGIGEAPISISSSPTKKGTFDLVVREVGNVTHALHQMKAGAKVGIRGPFGNGFDVKELKGKNVVIIGGGIGIVPLRSMINYALDNRKDFNKVSILYGSKRPAELLFKDEFAAWEKNTQFLLTVDKGDETWKGRTGVITTLIPDVDFSDPANTYALIVGPPIMYKFVLMSLDGKIPHDHKIVSLERKMKCGVGKCGHCQIHSLYVCQKGPVFKYDQMQNKEEAF